MRSLLLVVVALSFAACGGGDDSAARDIPVEVRTDPPSVVAASKSECRFDGETQVLAGGVVKNAGDNEHHVNIEVRFLDADGVRVELMSDSVSSLERGESAHWDVSFSPDNPDDIVKCEIATTAS